MTDRQDWIGRCEAVEDVVDAALLTRFTATLDTVPAVDGVAPQGFHWCLCAPSAATAQLDPDGHPRRDSAGLIPPIPLPRRMWASSKVRFDAPLCVGERVTRASRLLSMTEKQGGSGQLVFVEVEHNWAGQGGPAVREVQTIVYRGATARGTPPAPPPLGHERFDASGAQAHRIVHPQPPLLFRYSALTFNSHRIHYDLPYARDIEGYRGLVVHGPLTATLLLDLARRTYGEQPLASFAFRGISPAVAGEPLHLCLQQRDEGLALDAFAADGRLVMQAIASRR